MAANTDCKAEEGETETVPVNAVTLGVVSNNALPKEYIHIWNQNYINAVNTILSTLNINYD